MEGETETPSMESIPPRVPSPPDSVPPRPPPPHLRPRPPITLKIPTNQSPHQQQIPQTAYYFGSPMVTIPMTPVSNLPLNQQDIAFNVNLIHAYPNKASEFMFKRFEGFRDFTMNTAKSGLSVGEKSAFWMYGKMRVWSKKWFTHFFLLMVVCAYSIIGATIFVAVEGNFEKKHLNEINDERRILLYKIKELWTEMQPVESNHDIKEWMGRAIVEMRSYEEQIIEHFKQGQIDKGGKPQWNFWSAVFYCGTIYTTIDI